MKVKIRTVLLFIALVFYITGCGVVDKMTEIMNEESVEHALLENVPTMDKNAFNRFLFTMNITAGNMDGDGKEFNMEGAVETYRTISHLYNLDINFPKSGYTAKAESWTDFRTGEIYKDLGEGWVTSGMRNEHAIEDLVDAINNRNTEIIISSDESACTLSWTFPTDDSYLFGAIVGHYTDDENLNGYGRITAILDPETYEFQYFTFVISTSNEERAGALLDATFYWDVKNNMEDGLQIPDDISKEVYEKATGVSGDGGYDPVVNPLAEDFIELYGGIAEVTNHRGGAVMFWTLDQEDTSVTVNYAKENDPETRFEENYKFLASLYGSPAEETDDGVYFYNPGKGELIYTAKGDDWYAEVTVIGKSGMSQGELRKPLITYKAKLGI